MGIASHDQSAGVASALKSVDIWSLVPVQINGRRSAVSLYDPNWFTDAKLCTGMQCPQREDAAPNDLCRETVPIHLCRNVMAIDLYSYWDAMLIDLCRDAIAIDLIVRTLWVLSTSGFQ